MFWLREEDICKIELERLVKAQQEMDRLIDQLRMTYSKILELENIKISLSRQDSFIREDNIKKLRIVEAKIKEDLAIIAELLDMAEEVDEDMQKEDKIMEKEDKAEEKRTRKKLPRHVQARKKRKSLDWLTE